MSIFWSISCYQNLQYQNVESCFLDVWIVSHPKRATFWQADPTLPHIPIRSHVWGISRHSSSNPTANTFINRLHIVSSCIILHCHWLSCVICVNRICRSCWSLAASSVGIRPPGITANSLCDFRGTKGINRVQVWSGMYRLRKYGEIRRVRVQCRVQPGATDDLFVRFCATDSWYLVMLVLPSYTSMYQLAFATTCQLLPLRSFE